MAEQANTEAALIQASLKGNGAAFEGLVAKYQSMVCAITYGATGDISISEELAQEAFVKAWKDLAQLRELTKFKAWVCSITRTTISNYRRREKKNLISKATPLESAGAISADVPDPGHNLMAKEQQAVVAQALLQLPESYREPLILFYRQNQSTRQVAEQLELSEDNVRTRLHRGRKMLREQVVAMVEKTLANSAPGKAFTAAVMASVGVAIKSSGVAAAATTSAMSASSATGTAVMSGITAKLVTAAAVAALAVGAVSAYKRMSQPDQPPAQTNAAAAVADEQEAVAAPDRIETPAREQVAHSPAPIETPEVQTASVSRIPQEGDAPKTEPASLTRRAKVPENSEYAYAPKGVLSGLITDKDTGEPVIGAEIVVYGVPYSQGKLVTDRNGFYSLEEVKHSKPYKIMVKSKGYVGKPDIDDDHKISINKDKQQVVHFQLAKACMAELWVKDEQGNPIKGADIEVVDLVTNRSTAISRSDGIEPTDKDGFTLIGGHPTARAGYMAIITHKGRTGKTTTSSRGNTYHEREPDFAPAHIVMKNTDPDIMPVFDVTMKKGRPIKGSIVYADGVPASDLKIVTEPLWWSKTNLSGPRTDVAPDGSFILSHMTPEKYSIQAYYPVKRSYNPIKTIDFAQHDGELHLTLAEPSPQSLLSIKGTVKVIKKAPVGNLYIHIRSYNTSTNTHGSGTAIWDYDDNDEAKFEINRLKAGNYRLRFRSEHFKEVVLEDIQPPADDLYIEMEQMVKPEIVVAVIDKATGKPMTRMRARLIKTASRLGSPYGVSEKWLERSNPQGRAAFTVTPGVYQVQVMADGYGLALSEEIDTEDLRPVTVELAKGGTVKGRVVNALGEPIAGAKILALSYAGGNRARNRDEFTHATRAVASDAQGNFVVADLPEGLESLKATHQDHAPVIMSDIAVMNGEVSDEIIIKMEAGAVIEGYVFDNNGDAIGGARIDCDRDRERIIMGKSTKFVVTDPNGYYRIKGLGENSYLIARNRGSFSEGVVCRRIAPVCGETTRLDFGGEGQIVTGTVVLNDMPSANLKLALRGEAFGQFLGYTTTNAEGDFVFTGITKGKYNLGPGDDSDTLFASVKVTNMDIDLGVIGNNLVDMSVVIAAHVDWEELQYISLIMPPTSMLGQQRDETDKQNRLWRFPRVLPGTYKLRVMNKKATAFAVEVDITENQIEPLKIEPPKLDATLSGRFYRSVSNQALPRYLSLTNYTKTFSAYLVPAQDGVADANGQFETKLPSGQYQISFTDGKDRRLVKVIEIASGQHMELEIDLDAAL